MIRIALVATWDERLKKEAGRGARWVGGRLDTLAALVAGVTAATLVGTGRVENSKDLAAITLAVLSVVAFSLVVERSLRFKSGKELEEVRDRVQTVLAQVQTTHEAVRVLESGSPYHVVESDSTWDIQGDGSASVVRRKRLRFSQEDVVTVIDWVKGDGSIHAIKYRPSAEDSPIHSYINDGRQYSLIALDRPYGRDEELDFVTERTMEDCFVKTPDRITVVPLESTSLVKMRVRWPAGHVPHAVRFSRRTDTERQKPISLPVTQGEGGRPETKVEAERPERGERLCVEWDWSPPAANKGKP
jgi:hypothetical protein